MLSQLPVKYQKWKNYNIELVEYEFLTVVTMKSTSFWHIMQCSITPWLVVHKRTIPTERPPLVGEVVGSVV
jgi:hypothetical protein